MDSNRLTKIASAARWLLLIILAGHLQLRQAFAHYSLGDLPTLFGAPKCLALQHAYLTEVALILLLPAAVLVLRQRMSNLYDGSPGIGLFLALAFILWGAGHAVVALVAGRDTYLIFRQTALAGYAIFFIYAVIFFGDQARHIRLAVLTVLIISLASAAIDAVSVAVVNPNDPVQSAQHPVLAFFAATPYGQETLPIAILGLGFVVVCADNWFWRGLALLGLALAGWRQGVRFQSVVPISMAGALALYLLLGIALALRGQARTLKRALALLVFFGLLAWGYHYRHNDAGEPREVKAWSWDIYKKLFDVYAHATAPQDPKDYVFSTRAAVQVTDPEIYKLNAVSNACEDLSVRNNIWRFLVWRRMTLDWSSGRTFVGAGVGRPWFYGALYHTSFHYGEDRLGLDPHNSYLNLLYRYGVVGFLIFLALLWSVWHCVWKALRTRSSGGDLWLECMVLYFFYTAVFVSFTVGLEGPSYSMPFWMALGLIYAQARQFLHV
ncbi:MAG: hypothetical protein V1899_05150 [Planctomycetota bacterium]